MSNAVPGSSFGWLTNRARNNYSSNAPTQGSAASITIGALATLTHVLTGFSAELRISGAAAVDVESLQVLDGASVILAHTMFIPATSTAFDRFPLTEINVAATYGNQLIIKFTGCGAASAEELAIFWHDAG